MAVKLRQINLFPETLEPKSGILAKRFSPTGPESRAYDVKSGYKNPAHKTIILKLWKDRDGKLTLHRE